MAKDHITRVKGHGTVKFYKMPEDERRAYLQGGGALKRLRERKVQAAVFCAERDVALRALDIKMMEDFCRRWGQPVPETYAESDVPLAIMHKARLAIPAFTAEEKQASRQWLLDHGYSEDVHPSALNAVKEALVNKVFIKDIPPPKAGEGEPPKPPIGEPPQPGTPPAPPPQPSPPLAPAKPQEEK